MHPKKQIDKLSNDQENPRLIGTEFMSQTYSFSRFIYLDTWVFSKLINEPKRIRSLFDFLTRHDLCIAVSRALLLELSDALHQHADLNTLLTMLPSTLIKASETILDEEVKSYPNRRTDTLLLWPLNVELGKQTITKWLSLDELKKGRRQQQLDAKKMKQRLDSVKSNFPPPKSGNYTREQAKEFAWRITVQWLASTHPKFLQELDKDALVLKADIFLSVQLYAYYVYYKYYLDNREPKKLSDFGDLFHLPYLPYCTLAILERDMSNILNKIKSHYKVLDGVEVKNVDFFEDRKQDVRAHTMEEFWHP